MPKKPLLWLITILLFLMSCSFPYQAFIKTPAATIDPTQAIQSALLTVTWGLPSQTPSPFSTPTATSTPQPPPTFTPTATLQPVVISKENINDLNITHRYGESAIMDLAFSPDDSRFLVLTTTELACFEAESGKQLWSIDTDMYYSNISFTQDGKKIRGLTNGGGIQQWSAESGQKDEKLFFIQPNLIRNALSSNGSRLLLTNYDYQSTLYDTDTAKKVGDFPRSNLAYGVYETTMTSDGSYILMYGLNSPSTPMALVFKDQEWTFNVLNGIRGNEFGFTISPDDKRISAISIYDLNGNLMDYSSLSLWTVGDYNLYMRRSVKGTALQVNLSADGNTAYFAIFGENRVGFMDVNKARDQYFQDINVGNNQNTIYDLEWLEGHEYPVSRLKTSPGGKWLASCDLSGAIKIWDLASKQTKAEIKMDFAISPDSYTSVSLIPSQKLFARPSFDHSEVELIDTVSSSIVKTFSGNTDSYYYAISLSPDGTLLAAGEIKSNEFKKTTPSQNMVIWDVATGKQIMNLAGGHNRMINQTKISPDNQYAASVSYGQLIIWDIVNVKSKQVLGGYSSCDFSPDSKNILYDNADYGVYITDIISGKLLNFQRAEYIWSVSYAPDGLTAAIGATNLADTNDEIIFYMDTQPPYQKKDPKVNNLRSHIEYLAYSPDGSLIASIDNYGTLYINDPLSGAELYRMDNLTIPSGLTFTKDGSAILVGAQDGSMIVIEALKVTGISGSAI